MNKISVNFCDNTVAEEDFEETAWGKITARERFAHFVDMGNDNHTVFAKHPHVLAVTIQQEKDNVTQRFTCDCARQVIAAQKQVTA